MDIEEKRRHFYVCKRMRLCRYLLNKGFEFLKIRPDRVNPKYNVWIFKYSDELYQAVTDYYASFGVVIRPLDKN